MKKQHYVSPEMEQIQLAFHENMIILASQVISLSGSSGENISGSTNYDDDWQ